MKKTLIIAISIIGIILIVFVINKFNKNEVKQMQNQNELIVKQLYIDLCEASINKNLDKLDEILSDDYILVHMTGMKQSKEDYIESVKTGELAYFESKHESIEVDINGYEATIIGKTKTLASPFGSSKSWWNLRQDLKAEKIDGKWILTYSKASTF